MKAVLLLLLLLAIVGSLSGSKPKIYKYTKMPVTSFKSPVIKDQTRTASRTSKYPKYIAAGAVTYYLYSNAPVYREYYPMYGMHLRIPPERGIRVMEERQEIVNVDTNQPCYGVTENKAYSSYTPATRDSSYTDTALNAEIEKPANTTTKIVYEDGVEQVFTGLNNNEIDASEKRVGTQFNATTTSDYDKNITGTKIQGNCTRVMTKTSANIIRVYDENPNATESGIEWVWIALTVFLLVSSALVVAVIPKLIK